MEIFSTFKDVIRLDIGGEEMIKLIWPSPTPREELILSFGKVVFIDR